MQAEIFQKMCESVWEIGSVTLQHPEHGTIETDKTWEIAAMFGGARQSFPQAGVDVILFPDGSGALCGTRGASVIAVWSKYDHGDPNA